MSKPKGFRHSLPPLNLLIMLIRPLLYLFTALILSVFSLPAQHPADESSPNIYVVKDWPTGVKDTLAPWICQPLPFQTFIGISDPLVSPETGKRQAIQRALMLYNLSQGCSVKLLNETFESTTGQKPEDINDYKMVTMMCLYYSFLLPHYTIQQEYRSRFGETVVLLSVSPEKKSTDLCKGIIEIMQICTRDRQEYYDLRFDFNQALPGDSVVREDRFLLRCEDKKRLITSSINKVPAPANRGRFNYVDTLTKKENTKDTLFPAIPLFHSLWCGYVESLANQLTLHHYSACFLKGMSNDGNDTSESLSREITQSKLYIYLKDMHIQNNHLTTQWEIKEKKE